MSIETLEDVAGKAARRYKQLIHLGWWSDYGELKQEAMVAALSAKRTWDPLVGVPLNAYVWRACILHLGKYIWKQSAPVSETDHRLRTLAHVCRAELVDEHLEGGDGFELVFEDWLWRENTRAHIRLVLRETQGDDALLTVAVLLDGCSPREVAQAAGVTSQHVHRLTQRARTVLSNNLMLYDMLRDR